MTLGGAGDVGGSCQSPVAYPDNEKSWDPHTYAYPDHEKSWDPHNKIATALETAPEAFAAHCKGASRIPFVLRPRGPLRIQAWPHCGAKPVRPCT